jgi:hypothetical protein
MPTEEWMDKEMWYTHTMKYYSASKRKEILTHATTWMNFEDTILSEISQPQEDKYCMNLFKWDAYSSKVTETESRMVATMGWGVMV